MNQTAFLNSYLFVYLLFLFIYRHYFPVSFLLILQYKSDDLNFKMFYANELGKEFLMSLLCCCVFLFLLLLRILSVEAPKCPDFGTQLDCDKAALPQITPPVTPQKVLLYNSLLFILSFSFSLIYSYTHSLVCFSCLFYRSVSSVGTRVG